ncbi:hypothetical protein BaRGS_00033664, partial [Batillaria attramentaria]
ELRCVLEFTDRVGITRRSITMWKYGLYAFLIFFFVVFTQQPCNRARRARNFVGLFFDSSVAMRPLEGPRRATRGKLGGQRDLTSRMCAHCGCTLPILVDLGFGPRWLEVLNVETAVSE